MARASKSILVDIFDKKSSFVVLHFEINYIVLFSFISILLFNYFLLFHLCCRFMGFLAWSLSIRLAYLTDDTGQNRTWSQLVGLPLQCQSIFHQNWLGPCSVVSGRSHASWRSLSWLFLKAQWNSTQKPDKTCLLITFWLITWHVDIK